MNQAVKVSSVLAGVSFVAMAAFAGPVLADVGPGPYQNTTSAVPVTNITAYDYLVIEDYSVTGDFTNNGAIGGGILENKVGIELKEVDGVTLIDGDLINNAVVTANVFESGPDAVATGLLVWNGADITGAIVNNGEIAAYATSSEVNAVYAVSPSARALGLSQNDADLLASANLYNEGAIAAYAESRASGYFAYEFEVEAIAATQRADGNSADVYAFNAGLISALATVNLSNTYAFTSDVDAMGLLQDAGGGTTTVDLYNEGTIEAVAAVRSSGLRGRNGNVGSDAVNQLADGAIADLSAINHGLIFGSASFYGEGAITGSPTVVDDQVTPTVVADGISQSATVTDDATVSLYNDGVIRANARAQARGYFTFVETTAGAVSQTVNAVDVAELTIVNDNVIEAYSTALGTSLGGNLLNYANANARAVHQKAEARVASATLRNTGTISASARAKTIGYTVWSNDGSTGVNQEIQFAEIANLTAINLGDIEAYGAASESGVDVRNVRGDVSGLSQSVRGTQGTEDLADLYVENDGNIIAHSLGNAAAALSQNASEVEFVTIEAINRDLIEAKALRSSVESVGAINFAVATAVYQQAQNSVKKATLSLYNDGMITAEAGGSSRGKEQASYGATAVAVKQASTAGEETNVYAWNLGTIRADVDVFAAGDGILAASATNAFVTADAGGIYHEIDRDGARISSVQNSSALSLIDVDVTAEARGTGRGTADAEAFGVHQRGWDGATLVETRNLGAIDVRVSAVASTTDAAEFQSDPDAEAKAIANGVIHHYRLKDGIATARLDNSGDVLATAFADADGYDDSAFAAAKGYQYEYSEYNPRNNLNLDFENYAEGVISGTAGATANTDAKAIAAGVWLQAGDGAYIEGNGLNAGLISASAYAEGTDGYAQAYGVAIISNVARASTMTNTGLIEAFARGVNPSATGIAVASRGSISGVDVLDEPEAIVRNSGGAIVAGIIAGPAPGPAPLEVQGPEGETLLRGNAFNLAGFLSSDGFKDVTYGAAPGATVVNLRGGEAGSAGKAYVDENDAVSQDVADAFAEAASYGYVYGNILLTEDDRIEVTDGVTLFDGIVNPVAADVTPVLVGDLNVNNNGTLVLLQNTREGASRGYVDELNVGSNGKTGDGRALSNGTLAYELTPSTGEGDYSKIFANKADIANGTLMAVYHARFYDEETIYQNIIDANVLNGKFASVIDNSVLLNTNAVYEIGDETNNVGQNVDLVTTRTGFGDVAGLTRNQRATGDGIEKVYDPANMPKGAFSDLVASMFTISDEKAYNDFLDQLSGAEYAQQLQSVLWSTRTLNRVVTDRMECTDGSSGGTQTASAKVGDNTVMPTADAPMASTGCFEPGEASVWMSGYGQWTALDGDDEAPGLDETQYGILFGADYSFDESWFAGIAGGYFNSNGDFEDWGGRSGGSSEYDGLQVAAYGGYDNSTYYLRGVLAYGNYDGSVDRNIDTTELVQGLGTTGNLSGDPSSNVFSFYGETGYRFAITDAGNITPFAGLSLASATLEGFTEDDNDGTGAALDVEDSDASSVASVLGLRLDADMAMSSGVFTPSVSVAWMHEFGDTEQTVDASFADAPGSDFSVIGSEVARDSVLVDAGANFSMDDTFDFGLFYNGQFNENYSANAVSARLGYRF